MIGSEFLYLLTATNERLFRRNDTHVNNVAFRSWGLPSMDNSEVEDLWPTEFLAGIVTRYLGGPDEDFEDIVKDGTPIVGQVEQYAEKHGVDLGSPGWKVEIARKATIKLGAAPIQQDESPARPGLGRRNRGVCPHRRCTGVRSQRRRGASRRSERL